MLSLSARTGHCPPPPSPEWLTLWSAACPLGSLPSGMAAHPPPPKQAVPPGSFVVLPGWGTEQGGSGCPSLPPPAAREVHQPAAGERQGARAQEGRGPAGAHALLRVLEPQVGAGPETRNRYDGRLCSGAGSAHRPALHAAPHRPPWIHLTGSSPLAPRLLAPPQPPGLPPPAAMAQPAHI